MDKKIRDAISCSMRGFRLPRYHEIPDVGLYLEQTTKYVNQCISSLGFEDVTGSMIRNYVKQGLISNPVQKQYSAEQIAYVIALAILKHVCPLEHINSLFLLMDEEAHYTVPVAYNYFCDELENTLQYYFGLKESIDAVGVTSTLEKDMLRSAITAFSHIVYLNRCFRIIAEEKEKEAK